MTTRPPSALREFAADFWRALGTVPVPPQSDRTLRDRRETPVLLGELRTSWHVEQLHDGLRTLRDLRAAAVESGNERAVAVLGEWARGRARFPAFADRVLLRPIRTAEERRFLIDLDTTARPGVSAGYRTVQQLIIGTFLDADRLGESSRGSSADSARERRVAELAARMSGDTRARGKLEPLEARLSVIRTAMDRPGRDGERAAAHELVEAGLRELLRRRGAGPAAQAADGPRASGTPHLSLPARAAGALEGQVPPGPRGGLYGDRPLGPPSPDFATDAEHAPGSRAVADPAAALPPGRAPRREGLGRNR